MKKVSITFCSSVLHLVFQRKGPWEDSSALNPAQTEVRFRVSSQEEPGGEGCLVERAKLKLYLPGVTKGWF